MADPVNKLLLKEDEARLLRPTFITATGSREFWRGWETPDTDIQEQMDWLEQYTDTKNSKPTNFVTDPRTKEGQTHKGLWVASRVFYDSDDSKLLVQALQRVTEITALKDLTGLDYLISSENEILRPFGIVSGEQDTKAYIYQNLTPDSQAKCEGFSDADLVAALPGAGWTYVDRKFEVQENNTATFTIVFQKIAWNAWGHDSYAPDTIDYPNAGTKNEKEGQRKTWTGIQNSDLAVAIADCREGTNVPAPSGYVITEAGVNDNQDGSITLFQTIKKQVDNKDLIDTRVLHAHGWQPGAVLTLTTSYEDFYQSSIDSATSGESTPSGYTLVGIQNRRGSNGLHSRYFLYELVTWEGDWANNKKRTVVLTPGKEGETVTDVAKGLPESGIDALFSTVAADTGYTILSKQLQEGAFGEQIVSRRQQKLNEGTTSADALIIFVQVNLGDQTPMLRRQWYRRSEASKDTLTTVSTGAATTSFTYNGTVYAHARWNVTDHHDGAYTVTQTLINYDGLSAIDTSIDVVKPYIKSYLTTGDFGEERFVTWEWRAQFQLFLRYRGSRVEAWTAVNDSTKTIISGSTGVTRFSDYLYEGRFLHDVGAGSWAKIGDIET